MNFVSRVNKMRVQWFLKNVNKWNKSDVVLTVHRR